VKLINELLNEKVIYSEDERDMSDPEVLVKGVGRYKLSGLKKNVERKLADIIETAKAEDSPEKWRKLAFMLDHAAMREMVKTIAKAHEEIADRSKESKR